MNLVKMNNGVTMSSLEIATLTNKEHKHVIRDIREMLKVLKASTNNYTVIEHKDTRGYNSEFLLDYNHVLCLIMGYTTETRMMLLKKINIEAMQIVQALQDFEVPDEVEDMYVYAIKNETTGNIKLGISKDPEQRLKQLQTGNDCKLTLVAYKKAENKFKDEAMLHYKNSPLHIRGEWFESKAVECFN